MYHIRKFYNEEDIMKLFEEVEEEETEDDGDDEGSTSIEDVDIDSLSDEEKVSFAIELLKSIDSSDDDIQEKVDDALDCLDDISFDSKSEDDED